MQLWPSGQTFLLLNIISCLLLPAKWIFAINTYIYIYIYILPKSRRKVNFTLETLHSCIKQKSNWLHNMHSNVCGIVKDTEVFCCLGRHVHLLPFTYTHTWECNIESQCYSLSMHGIYYVKECSKMHRTCGVAFTQTGSTNTLYSCNALYSLPHWLG